MVFCMLICMLNPFDTPTACITDELSVLTTVRVITKINHSYDELNVSMKLSHAFIESMHVKNYYCGHAYYTNQVHAFCTTQMENLKLSKH